MRLLADRPRRLYPLTRNFIDELGAMDLSCLLLSRDQSVECTIQANSRLESWRTIIHHQFSASTLKLAHVGIPMHATRNDGSRKSHGVWIYILPAPK